MALFRSVETCRRLHIPVLAQLALDRFRKKPSREIISRNTEAESCSHKLHHFQKNSDDLNFGQKTSVRKLKCFKYLESYSTHHRSFSQFELQSSCFPLWSEL